MRNKHLSRIKHRGTTTGRTQVSTPNESARPKPTTSSVSTDRTNDDEIKLPNRVYAIKYRLCTNLYCTEGEKWENREEFFNYPDRSKWVDRYLSLQGKHYVSDLKVYYGDLEEVNMRTVVSTI